MDPHLEAIAAMPLTRTKAELMKRILTARAALDRCVASLSTAQLATPGPGGGWAAKDHLSHLATWEEILAAHLRGGSEHAAVGMDEATYARHDMDSLNAAIYELHSQRDAHDVLARFAAAHTAMLDQLNGIDEAALQQPYLATDPEQRTVMQELADNTYQHYIQHLRWIEAQLTATT